MFAILTVCIYLSRILYKCIQIKHGPLFVWENILREL